ncbi:MAG TPA: YdeI/OmpD-associated family protein [Bacteroidia bacterium]|nr:YdeI/OmpD-associated family protein [Bacteroidia bacterium]
MQEKNSETFYPKNRQEWRKWLQKNHAVKDSVWLVYYKKNTGMPTITWSDAVDEALCFGWIDSKARPVDDETFIHFFCKRKAKGTWSKINKEKIERLSKEKLMTPAGLAVIAAAKNNGSWTILDEVEELIIPKDLAKAFRSRPGSKAFFLSLSKSVKKMMLSWLVLAKREETRQKRIDEIAEHAAQHLKPKQFR